MTERYEQVYTESQCIVGECFHSSRTTRKRQKGNSQSPFDRIHTQYKDDDVEGQRQETLTFITELQNNGCNERFMEQLLDKHRKKNPADDMQEMKRFGVPYVACVNEQI